MAVIAGAPGGGLDWSQGSTTEQPMKRATYEDVLSAPENKVAEILDGELFLSPRPAPRHALAHSTLFAAVHGHRSTGVSGGPGGWWILDRARAAPRRAGRRPRRRRLASRADAGDPGRGLLPLAPDWVCEVLSASTERIDRGRKLRIYAEAGVAHAWFVKPTDRTLEVFRLRDGAWTIVGVWEGAAAVRAEPFAAIELELAPLWGDPAPPASP